MAKTSDSVDHFTGRLTRIFESTPDKYAAMEKSRAVLLEMSGTPEFLAGALARYLQVPGAFNKKHYPVVGVDILTTPHFGLVANCWIPLPDHSTHISTKAIHHHGEMLLNTATAFGPGYEHWLFTPPELVDETRELFAMQLLERAPHPLHHIGFVDAHIAHVPFYPASLTVTLALWTSRQRVSWKDRVKRLAVLKGKEKPLKDVAVKLGLRHALDLKVVEYHDYHPTPQGFVGMQTRTEFPLGPNADYLHGLFYVLQGTGNDALASIIEEQLESAAIEDRILVRELLAKLMAGTAIEGRLSQGHYGVPFANFSANDVERALALPINQRMRA